MGTSWGPQGHPASAPVKTFDLLRPGGKPARSIQRSALDARGRDGALWTGGSSPRNSLPPSPGGWASKIRVLAGVFLSKPLSVTRTRRPLSVSSHGRPSVRLCPTFPFS